MTPEDHTGGPVGCDQLGPFVDGELAATEAAAFRRHLVDCARCQQEMHGLMQLSALAERARQQRQAPVPERAPVPVAAADRRARPRRAAWLGVVGAAAMAAALVLAIRGGRSGPDMPALLASLDARTVSGWPSAAGPAQYRPYAVSRGTEQSTPPSLARAALKAEEANDLRSIATLALLRRDFVRADAVLGQLPARPDVLADRGLVRMEQGRCEDALEYLDQALAAQPGYLPALFNRGLCLRQLGLPVAAAAALGKVTDAQAGGWSTEAGTDRLAVEQRAAAQKARERAFAEERKQLVVSQETPPPEFIHEFPARARVRFNAALASAGTKAELERLLPTAHELDALAGDTVLEQRIRSALRTVRPERAAIAAQFRDWFLQQKSPLRPEAVAFIGRAVAAGQVDQALEGWSNFVPDDAPELRARMVRAARDPFHEILLAAAVAAQQRERGLTLDAERTVREVQSRCGAPSLEIACFYLDQQAVDIDNALGRFREAAARAGQSAQTMRRAALLGEERQALLQLADVKLDADRLGAARATWEEIGLREPSKCRVTVWRNEKLAAGYVRRRDGAAARAILDAQPSCDLPMDPWRYELRLDVAQLLGDEAGVKAVASALAKIEPGAVWSEREGQEDAFLLDRARLELGDPAATALGQLPPAFEDDSAVRRAWTRATVARYFAALRRDATPEAVNALATASGVPGAERCVAAVGRDLTRTGWAVIGSSGEQRSGSAPRRDTPVSDLLPPEARRVLATCSEVSVVTTADLQGVADLLPESLAWSFAVAARPATAATGTGRLLVRDTRPPPELGLPPLQLQGLPQGAGWSVLEGAEATPRRVLEAMGSPGFIEFAVHGRIDGELPDGAMLMLSEDPDRNYALSAAALRTAHLRGNPLIILGACHAGTGSAMRDEPWSLPRALVEAGARTVIASRAELPDAEASQFFEGVRRRVESGSAPRVALRDERLAWLQKGRDWVREVVAFD